MTDRAWESSIDLGYLVSRYRGTAERIVDDGVALVAKRALRATPKRTGQTRASQNTGRDGVRGWVAYNSAKAVPLHEKTGDRHRVGRAKFLETELVGSAATIRKRAVAEFRAATQGGGR